MVDTLALPVVEAPGFEADDVIATLAERAKVAGEDVIIVTGDRDSYQLVENPHVRVLYNRRGVSDYALYDEEGILERTGVKPSDYVFYAALRGDPSDNLPGVPGVGEKTAAKLVNKYGTIDELFAHAAEQTPKLAQSLEANEDQVRMNAQMMALIRDVDLAEEVTSLRVGSIDADEVAELFGFLEFFQSASPVFRGVRQYLSAPLAAGDARVGGRGDRAGHRRRGRKGAGGGDRLRGRWPGGCRRRLAGRSRAFTAGGSGGGDRCGCRGGGVVS